jgi:hypothetical protein
VIYSVSNILTQYVYSSPWCLVIVSVTNTHLLNVLTNGNLANCLHRYSFVGTSFRMYYHSYLQIRASQELKRISTCFYDTNFPLVHIVTLEAVRMAVTKNTAFWDNTVIDECRVVGRMRIGRRNPSTRWKPAQMPLCPPQILHDLTRARTRTAVGSRQLTAWATARPTLN